MHKAWDVKNRTPLHRVQGEETRFLMVANGLDINGQTPLHQALANGRVRAARVLHSHLNHDSITSDIQLVETGPHYTDAAPIQRR